MSALFLLTCFNGDLVGVVNFNSGTSKVESRSLTVVSPLFSSVSVCSLLSRSVVDITLVSLRSAPCVSLFAHLLGTHLCRAEQKGQSFLQEQLLFLHPDLQEQEPSVPLFLLTSPWTTGFFSSSRNAELLPFLLSGPARDCRSFLILFIVGVFLNSS